MPTKDTTAATATVAKVVALRGLGLLIASSLFRRNALTAPRFAFKFELGLAGLILERVPHPLAQGGETRVGQRLARPGMRQIDVDDLLDAARPALQHRDTIAEQDRLLDRVRDEQHAR